VGSQTPSIEPGPWPRRAIVTGGAGGLGKACAERLAADGLEVVTADIDPVADLFLDVTGEIPDLGRTDVLINCAGVAGPSRPLWEVTDAQWLNSFAVNTFGTFRMCRAVVPGMVERGWGRIVNFASMAGKDGNPNASVYSAAKAAVIGLTKSLGKELVKTGVLVNAVAPAVFESPMNAATSPEAHRYQVSLIPMGRMGRPAELAELVSWLASERCSFSTGAVYDISGGRATY
jgi:2-dehydro-3-deoxy-L-rhamnonate dehydrogenase (NAD+)